MLINRLKVLLLSFSFAAFLAVPGTLFSSDATEPEYYRIKIGKIEVIAIKDADSQMKAELVKNGDPAVVKKIMPYGKLSASVNVYVIKTGSKNILIDTGIGERGSGRGMMPESMKKARIDPGDVDVILITHAHSDHVGGLVKEGKAVFPKAVLLFSEKEAGTFSDDAIKSLSADSKIFYEPANRAFKIYGKRAATFKDGEIITEGVKAVDLSGHTPGHTGFLIESDGKKLLMFGDLLHITDVQFPYPGYSLVYDTDTTKAAEIRKAALGMAASEKMLVAGVHIMFPGIGYVTKKGTGYSFSPVK